MKQNGFENLKELMLQAKSLEPTPDQILVKVKSVFKKSIDKMKINGERPELEVSKFFLENYHREHGIKGIRDLLSKTTLMLSPDGFDFLVSLKLIKRKATTITERENS